MLDRLEPGDVVTVTCIDRLARSTRDLLNTLAAITGKQAGFRSLGDTWADITTPHGRLMLTVLGSLAEFERDVGRWHVSFFHRMLTTSHISTGHLAILQKGGSPDRLGSAGYTNATFLRPELGWGKMP
jgi:hypothetical protein